MTNQTPTERIRELLCERGVKFNTEDVRFSKATSWLAENGKLATFAEYVDGSTTFSMDSLSLTPEQAIAVTLGDVVPTKFYAIETWDELNDRGESHIPPKLFTTREGDAR